MINNNTRQVSNFALNLYRIREEKHVTREELAANIYVSSARLIYSYEDGSKHPSLDTLILIANYLGVSLDSLFRKE